MRKFKEKGYKVIHTKNNKISDVSGTKIRKIINVKGSKEELIEGGFMPEAVEGLFEVIENISNKNN